MTAALIIKPVKNGWMAESNTDPCCYPRPDQIWVFETPVALADFIQDWARGKVVG